jgi:hypothetical protein
MYACLLIIRRRDHVGMILFEAFRRSRKARSIRRGPRFRRPVSTTGRNGNVCDMCMAACIVGLEQCLAHRQVIQVETHYSRCLVHLDLHFRRAWALR